MVGGKRPARSPCPLEPTVLPLAPNPPAPGPKLLRLLQAQWMHSLSPGSERHGQEASLLAVTRVVVETLLKVPHQLSGAPSPGQGKASRGTGCSRTGCYEEMGPVNSCQGPGVRPLLAAEDSVQGLGYTGQRGVPPQKLRGLAQSFSPASCRAGLCLQERVHPQGRGQGHRTGGQCFCMCQVPSSHPRGALLSTVCWALAPPHPGVSLWPRYRGSEALAPRAERQWAWLGPFLPRQLPSRALWLLTVLLLTSPDPCVPSLLFRLCLNASSSRKLSLIP